MRQADSHREAHQRPRTRRSGWSLHFLLRLRVLREAVAVYYFIEYCHPDRSRSLRSEAPAKWRDLLDRRCPPLPITKPKGFLSVSSPSGLTAHDTLGWFLSSTTLSQSNFL